MKSSVIIVSFSSRNNGNFKQICDLAAENINNPIEIYRFADFFIHPCGGCQYECFQDGTRCPYYDDKEVELLEAISDAAEMCFVVPNYSDHPCANFYIFNERSNCWFQNLPERLDQFDQAKLKLLEFLKR